MDNVCLSANGEIAEKYQKNNKKKHQARRREQRKKRERSKCNLFTETRARTMTTAKIASYRPEEQMIFVVLRCQHNLQEQVKRVAVANFG